jgi:hypothetical protein
MNTFKTALMAGIAALVVAACTNNDGTFEEAGEDIDEAIEDIQD